MTNGLSQLSNKPSMSRNGIYLIFLTAFAIVFALAAYRDIRYGKDFSYDLRNRVVAARLEKDGKLPYFYKWRKGDSIRYYDPQSFDSLAVSNITATPFFHQLMYPFADWDEQKINGWWLFFEYGMLILMTGMAFSLAGSDGQRGAVLAVTCLFLLTDAWKRHVYLGQNYICIPFFAMACYFFFQKKATAGRALMAGTMGIVLILIRPNTVLFFIPFLFLLSAYSRRYLIFFLVPALLLTAWTIIDTKERALWQDFQLAMREDIKVHQELHPAIQRNDPSPNYARWEGIDVAALDSAEINNPIKKYSENGNFFVIYKSLLHRKISYPFLLILSFGSIVFLTGLFYFLKVRKRDYDPAAVAILGYCLYMVSDLFSPVYRHQYYTVQWFFPILLTAAIYRPSFRWPFRLIIIGLLLNISKINFIKMQHTIGEYLILAALVLLVLLYKRVDRPGLASGKIEKTDRLIGLLS
jgi:hypothetical protein